MTQKSPEPIANGKGVCFQEKMHTEIKDEIPDTISMKQFSSLTNDQKKQYTAIFARYLLFGQNKGVPIKRRDLQEQIVSDHSRAFLPIIQLADRELRQTAGLAIIEFTKGVNKFYILKNIVEIDMDVYGEFVQKEPEKGAQMSLLCIILSFILMKQKVVLEEELWEFLSQLNIPEGDVHHPVLGNVKNLLTEWVKHMYLEKIKEPTPDKTFLYYKWGERSKAEYPPDKIITMVAKIHGDDPNTWLRIHKHLLPGEVDAPESPSASSQK